jgi:hypothetical protein
MEEVTYKPRINEEPPQEKAFRGRVWLQIYLPLGLGVLVIAGVAAWLWVGSVGSLSLWADISLLLLSPPVFLVGILSFIFLGAVSFGLIRIIQALPAPIRRAENALNRVEKIARRVMDRVARPFLILRAFGAAVRRAVQVLASIFALPK